MNEHAAFWVQHDLQERFTNDQLREFKERSYLFRMAREDLQRRGDELLAQPDSPENEAAIKALNVEVRAQRRRVQAFSDEIGVVIGDLTPDDGFYHQSNNEIFQRPAALIFLDGNRRLGSLTPPKGD